MFHLVLSACLANSPDTCAPRLLPAGDAVEQGQCEQKSGPIARDWLARHPELKGGAMRCVDTADLPALPVDEIADDVYLHQGAMGQISQKNQGRIANLGFIVGDTVAVIDAGGTRAEGEALYAAIRRVTDAPISHVVLTHMHPDHIMGAEVFSEAGASIVADARLPDAVARRASAWMMSVPRQIGAAAFAGTHLVPIDQKIDAPVTIPLGGTEITLTPQPSAHTDTDMTVRDSESGVLFTGDLVFRGLTPSIDGSLSGWLDWLAVPPEPAPTLIVPGHGPVAETWAEATAAQVQYLTELQAATRATLKRGTPLSQAIPAITAMMKPYSEGWADFSATTARNAATAYAQMEWE